MKIQGLMQFIDTKKDILLTLFNICVDNAKEYQGRH